MDENQRRTILKSIAISSGKFTGYISTQDRQEAFQILEQFKAYDGRIPVSIEWLHRERHLVDNTDVTVSTKLYVLSILQSFVSLRYARLEQQDRLMLRNAVLTAARQVAPSPVNDETRILGNKIASLMADLMVRDFPQRWTTFFHDVFVPVGQGGIWCADTSTGASVAGVKIGLECLKLVAEDCTDSDFNSKISTTRRNDVLIGLNEVSSLFLPLLFSLLEQYTVLVNAKSTLQNMRTYLLSNGRTLSQMTDQERSMYGAELTTLTQTGRLIADCLITLASFCHSMPLEWMFGSTNDFTTAFLHLLREPCSDIQIQAAECLQLLMSRKLDANVWFQFVSNLTQATNGANQMAQMEQEQNKTLQAVGGNVENEDYFVSQLGFHRVLSKLLSTTLSAHLANITNDKQTSGGSGSNFQTLSSFLRLLVDMLHHPSGRVAGEQIITWTGLWRDPQVVRTKLLKPFAAELLNCYLDIMVRIRWEDVEQQTHSNASLLEASWDDEDEYNSWLMDIRSKSSQLFKFMSNNEPNAVSSVLSSRIQSLLSSHGAGEPRDHLEPSNKQLTPKSEACIRFEALNQPLDNILHGLPSWSLQDGNSDRERAKIRDSVRASLGQMANAIVQWSPNYLWLKFRRAQLLEALRHYWKYDPSTLLGGVDSLLGYLSAPDEWNGVNGNSKLSGEIVGLKKKSGVALVAVAKAVPHHLVPWLSQLSEATKTHLSSQNLLPQNRMHLYEFLSCVATAVEDPVARSNFIADVLSDAVNTLESSDVIQSISSVEAFLSSLGIMQATNRPESVTDATNVKAITAGFVQLFSAFNQLLSVGKRCHEASRRRNKGMLFPHLSSSIAGVSTAQNFPDEGPISINDLAYYDPFVPLWPRILPKLIQVLDVTLNVWHPEDQAILLQDRIQRYTYAISDDEAYVSKQNDKASGGVFGPGGTAGSVVAGCDRRDINLVPRWSGWFNELRNTCFQLLGLVAGQRVLFAPELAELFPRFVSVVVNPAHLQAMEHRHMNQFLRQFVEILLLSCPSSLYSSHLAPIVGPLFEHMRYRLQKTWEPIVDSAAGREPPQALTASNCAAAAALASRGGDAWYVDYYARAGLFVGDLDAVTAEATLDKYRVDLGRTFSDVLQSAFALKGDWALVLANQAKEEQATKRNEPSKRKSGPRNQVRDGRQVNADGTPRSENQDAIDARKHLRISSMCHFLLLENETVAGGLTLTVIQCLGYPDAYTCRRCTRIGHRILEAVAWSPRYAPLLGNQMFVTAVKNIVTEPKWMVGIEWDMINLIRDVYCRLVLGQTLLPGGQGHGMQQPRHPSNPSEFEQAKTADKPLSGGGILASPSDLPRQVLATLPGVDGDSVNKLDKDMSTKRSAKDQKDFLRDLLRVAAESSKLMEKTGVESAAGGIFDRAVAAESLLNRKTKKAPVPDIPEKLVTFSMVQRKERKQEDVPAGLNESLFR